MTLALVLVIAAQIGTPKLKNCSVTDIINPDVVCNRATGQWVSCLGKQAHPACWCRWNDAKCFYRHESPKLPISTRRVEPLVVEPSNTYHTYDMDQFDVPAVQKTHKVPCKSITLFEGGGISEMRDCERLEAYWTCEDTRRALIQAENGTRHCVLFEGAR